MKITIIAFVFSLLVSGCSKDDKPQAQQDQLPSVTQIGANTAGCIIDGKVLIPKNGINSMSGYPAYGLTTGGGINFNAPVIGDDYWYLKIDNLRSTGKSYGIYLYIDEMTMGIGNYIVGQSNGEFYMDGPDNPQIIVSEFNDLVYTGKSFYSGTDAGTITITRFDYQNGIYSGIFNAILYNKDNPSEKIHVTDGRFDINLSTLNQ